MSLNSVFPLLFLYETPISPRSFNDKHNSAKPCPLLSFVLIYITFRWWAYHLDHFWLWSLVSPTHTDRIIHQGRWIRRLSDPTDEDIGFGPVNFECFLAQPHENLLINRPYQHDPIWGNIPEFSTDALGEWFHRWNYCDWLDNGSACLIALRKVT